MVVSSAALCAELSNDQKFTKSIGGPLIEIRALVGDGLFTVSWQSQVIDSSHIRGLQARKDEPNWGIARAYTLNCQAERQKTLYILRSSLNPQL